MIVFSLIGLAVNGHQGAFEVSRSALLIIGGLLLFYSGLSLLKDGNLPEDAFSLRLRRHKDNDSFDDDHRRVLFLHLPMTVVWFLISSGILLTTLIPEIILLKYL